MMTCRGTPSGRLTVPSDATLLNEVIRGAKVGCDVSHIDVRHLDLQVLVAVRRLQIVWVVVDGDDPATLDLSDTAHGMWEADIADSWKPSVQPLRA